MKPLIVFVDDEPNNLTVFEASMPPEWEVKTFTLPTQALQELSNLAPAVILTDQRMPEMNGVEFLEAARKIHPEAIRMIVTGYSDENLVIKSVRNAQVFDYLRKPWDPDDLEASIRRGVEAFKVSEERRIQNLLLIEREAILGHQNKDLAVRLEKLEAGQIQSSQALNELECWVPPALVAMIRKKAVNFPLIRDLVVITFGFQESAKNKKMLINKRPLHEHLFRMFSQSILRQGGWLEAHTGRIAYGYFGMGESGVNAHLAALAAAQEFQVMFKGLCQLNGISMECGIGLHLDRRSTIHMLAHEVQIQVNDGPFVQKAFDTTLSDGDVLSRIQELAQLLPGANMIMSGDFVGGLEQKPASVQSIGHMRNQDQSRHVELFLLSSESLKASDLARLQAALAERDAEKPPVAA